MQAIKSGRYHDVNSVSVATIVAARNAMKDVEIPYLFRGNGSAIITPADRREPLVAALRGVHEIAGSHFHLKIRSAVIPISMLQAQNGSVEVARYIPNKNVSFAMMRGNGLQLGDTWTQSPDSDCPYLVRDDGARTSNFEGFSNRWRAIPSQHGLVASIIIRALSDTPADRAYVYNRVLTEIESLVQLMDAGRPVSAQTLRLKPSKANFHAEAALRSAAPGAPPPEKILSQIRKDVRRAQFALRTGISLGTFRPAPYQNELIAQTDFQKFDNALRMHIDLRRGQLHRIKSVLQVAEDDGHLVYGIHTSDHTLMTCIVDSYQRAHTHFVDGGAGGYTLAARRIQTLLRDLKT